MTGGGVRRLPPPLPLIVLRATAEYPEFYLAVETLDEYAGLLRLVVEEKFGGGYPLPKRSSLRIDRAHGRWHKNSWLVHRTCLWH